jgi:hypothetical protein
MRPTGDNPAVKYRCHSTNCWPSKGRVGPVAVRTVVGLKSPSIALLLYFNSLYYIQYK